MFDKILFTKPHNQHYLNRYVKYIRILYKVNNNLEKCERHHICPKAKDLFPEYKNLKDNPWNEIKLTYKQHYIAHLILSRAYGGSQSFALFSMIRKSNKPKYINSKIYQNIKEEQLEYNKLSNSGDNHWSKQEGNIHNFITNHPKGMMGKCHTEEYKNYMKDINTGHRNPFYGKKHNKNTLNNISQKLKGRKWVTNGIKDKLINSNILPHGFKWGRCNHNSKSSKLIPINNGYKNSLIHKESKIPEGWFMGKCHTIFINNGTQMKMHPSIHQIPNGWVLGRINRKIISSDHMSNCS